MTRARLPSEQTCLQSSCGRLPETSGIEDEKLPQEAAGARRLELVVAGTARQKKCGTKDVDDGALQSNLGTMNVVPAHCQNHGNQWRSLTHTRPSKHQDTIADKQRVKLLEQSIRHEGLQGESCQRKLSLQSRAAQCPGFILRNDPHLGLWPSNNGGLRVFLDIQQDSRKLLVASITFKRIVIDASYPPGRE